MFAVSQVTQEMTHLVSTKPVKNLVPEEGVEQVLAIIGSADERTIAAGQKTAKQFVKFREEMDSRFATLSEENRALSVALTQAKSREVENARVNEAKVKALEEEVASFKQAMEKMRQEMVEKGESANERIAAAIQAQTVAVETAKAASHEAGFAAGKVEGIQSQIAVVERARQAGRAEVQQQMQQRLGEIALCVEEVATTMDQEKAQVKEPARSGKPKNHEELRIGSLDGASRTLKSIARNIRNPSEKVVPYNQCSVM